VGGGGVGDGVGGIPSDYLVSTQLQLLLFCCWGCGCCWAVTISKLNFTVSGHAIAKSTNFRLIIQSPIEAELGPLQPSSLSFFTARAGAYCFPSLILYVRVLHQNISYFFFRLFLSNITVSF